MGVSSLLIQSCESPCISVVSGKRFRAGLVRGKLLIATFLAGYQQLSADNRPLCDLAMRRGRKIAKVATARRLAVQMFWMWRKGWDYEQVRKFGSHAGQPGNRDGVHSNTE